MIIVLSFQFGTLCNQSWNWSTALWLPVKFCQWEASEDGRRVMRPARSGHWFSRLLWTDTWVGWLSSSGILFHSYPLDSWSCPPPWPFTSYVQRALAAARPRPRYRLCAPKSSHILWNNPSIKPYKNICFGCDIFILAWLWTDSVPLLLALYCFLSVVHMITLSVL